MQKKNQMNKANFVPGAVFCVLRIGTHGTKPISWPLAGNSKHEILNPKIDVKKNPMNKANLFVRSSACCVPRITYCAKGRNPARAEDLVVTGRVLISTVQERRNKANLAYCVLDGGIAQRYKQSPFAERKCRKFFCDKMLGELGRCPFERISRDFGI
jgi:hypothetical protein